MMRTWTANPRHEYAAIIVLNNNDNDGHESEFSLDFTTDFVLYAIIAVLVMVIALIMKLMRNINRDNIRATDGQNVPLSTESSRLLLSSSSEERTFSSCSSYGTINNSDEEDLLESGKLRNCSSSSEDLYDVKICVICYDHRRNCFFVPCGHCISCIPCAKRIIRGEIKSCPICRTFINKVANSPLTPVLLHTSHAAQPPLSTSTSASLSCRFTTPQPRLRRKSQTPEPRLCRKLQPHSSAQSPPPHSPASKIARRLHRVMKSKEVLLHKWAFKASYTSKLKIPAAPIATQHSQETETYLQGGPRSQRRSHSKIPIWRCKVPISGQPDKFVATARALTHPLALVPPYATANTESGDLTTRFHLKKQKRQ
ncbi:RING/U-box superfamily protein [Striga hermonthica]|uniref:RING/U-box superfamily protein n=1 Tax=Striga hermonthica TaxID=68872 RepID=A0A9N7P0N9_STRHE|nr:RING/U-box superfamily protein [Striga hermonthica]